MEIKARASTGDLDLFRSKTSRAMCQSVPNRRGRAAAARVIASAVDDGASSSLKARSQPSTLEEEEEKKPSLSSSFSANNTSTSPRPLTGDPAERQPTALPPFTIGTLRKAIPPHCFERSLLRSSLSLALDLALAAALAAFAAAGIPRVIPADAPFAPALRGLAWLAYWWLQGAVCTGIWVQAHECGHQAFSESKVINDSVGLIMHSLLLVRPSFRSLFPSVSSLSLCCVSETPPVLSTRDFGAFLRLLSRFDARLILSLLGSLFLTFSFQKKKKKIRKKKVPYFSWKHSHRRHHSNTGSVDRDEVFVPPVRRSKGESSSGGVEEGEEERKKEKTAAAAAVDNASLLSRALGSEQFLASAPGRLGAILFALTLGWPAYLLFNVSGRPTFPKGSWPNHFAPSSPIFTSRERLEVAISDAALAAVAAGLFFLGKKIGFGALFYLYFVPYLVVNAWLVTITLLQHTHPALPHYHSESWDWLRGKKRRWFFFSSFFFPGGGRGGPTYQKGKKRKKLIFSLSKTKTT